MSLLTPITYICGMSSLSVQKEPRISNNDNSHKAHKHRAQPAAAHVSFHLAHSTEVGFPRTEFQVTSSHFPPLLSADSLTKAIGSSGTKLQPHSLLFSPYKPCMPLHHHQSNRVSVKRFRFCVTALQSQC